MQFIRFFHTCLTNRVFLPAMALLLVAMHSHAADNLYITDDYLQGLNEELGDPEYLDKAKQDMHKSEQQEQNNTANREDIRKALGSMFNFEALLREKYPSSYRVYIQLPVSARILVYDHFKKTRKLSAAKRMLIEKYQAGNQ